MAIVKYHREKECRLDGFIDTKYLLNARLESDDNGKATICQLYYGNFCSEFKMPTEKDAKDFYNLILKAKESDYLSEQGQVEYDYPYKGELFPGLIDELNELSIRKEESK